MLRRNASFGGRRSRFGQRRWPGKRAIGLENGHAWQAGNGLGKRTKSQKDKARQRGWLTPQPRDSQRHWPSFVWSFCFFAFASSPSRGFSALPPFLWRYGVLLETTIGLNKKKQCASTWRRDLIFRFAKDVGHGASRLSRTETNGAGSWKCPSRHLEITAGGDLTTGAKLLCHGTEPQRRRQTARRNR